MKRAQQAAPLHGGEEGKGYMPKEKNEVGKVGSQVAGENATIDPEIQAQRTKAARDHLPGLVITQDGKPVVGEPTQGKYDVRLLPNMTLWGEASAIVRVLSEGFPGCEFAWVG